MLVTLQTLAEQMQLTERELEQRKALVQFGPEDAECLRSHRELISENIDEIIRAFYDNQLSVPEISLLIGDADTMGRLRGAMRRYILELFEGYYDLDYVNKRLRIGKVHKQIGVPPKYFISAIWLLERILNEKINSYAEQLGLQQIGDKVNRCLHKLLTLDTQFVFDTYIASLMAEVNIAKSQMEKQIEQLEVTITERTKSLETLSRSDGLTGLWNQNAFYEYLRHELASSERYKETVSLAYLDVDGFKGLNDTQGHVAGDQALILLAGILKESVRDCDIPCRVGGDEFAIIFPKTTLEDARVICERVIERLKNTKMLDITVSFGVAVAGNDYYPSMHDFIRDADRNMYSSKTQSSVDKSSHIN